MVASKSDRPHFSPGEKNVMKSLIRDYLLFGVPQNEIITALSQRLKREVSEKTYYILKKEVMAEVENPDLWLDKFVRSRIVEHYREQIETVKYVQRLMLITIQKEYAKDEKANKYLLNQLAKTITENSKVLAEFGMAPPIIAKIKSMIPLDITTLQKSLEDQKELATKTLNSFNAEVNDTIKDNKDDRTEPSQLPPSESAHDDNNDRPETAIIPIIHEIADDNGGTSTKADEDDNRVF